MTARKSHTPEIKKISASENEGKPLVGHVLAVGKVVHVDQSLIMKEEDILEDGFEQEDIDFLPSEEVNNDTIFNYSINLFKEKLGSLSGKEKDLTNTGDILISPTRMEEKYSDSFSEYCVNQFVRNKILDCIKGQLDGHLDENTPIDRKVQDITSQVMEIFDQYSATQPIKQAIPAHSQLTIPEESTDNEEDNESITDTGDEQPISQTVPDRSEVLPLEGREKYAERLRADDLVAQGRRSDLLMTPKGNPRKENIIEWIDRIFRHEERIARSMIQADLRRIDRQAYLAFQDYLRNNIDFDAIEFGLPSKKQLNSQLLSRKGIDVNKLTSDQRRRLVPMLSVDT